MGELSSISSGDESESEKGFHHPFLLKDRPNAIIMNIRVSSCDFNYAVFKFQWIALDWLYVDCAHCRMLNSCRLKRYWKKRRELQLSYACSFPFLVDSSIEKMVRNNAFNSTIYSTALYSSGVIIILFFNYTVQHDLFRNTAMHASRSIWLHRIKIFRLNCF